MTTYGSSLPEDLCYSICNIPTFFDIIPVSAEDTDKIRYAAALESFPTIPEELIAEVRSVYRKTSHLGCSSFTFRLTLKWAKTHNHNSFVCVKYAILLFLNLIMQCVLAEHHGLINGLGPAHERDKGEVY